MAVRLAESSGLAMYCRLKWIEKLQEMCFTVKQGHPKITPLVSNGGRTVEFDLLLWRLNGVNLHHLTAFKLGCIRIKEQKIKNLQPP